MKISEKILNLYPYLSTEWKNIASLHRENKENSPILIVELKTGSKVEIPSLSSQEMQDIFRFYEKYIEESALDKPVKKNPLGIDLKFLSSPSSVLPTLDLAASILQHDHSQAQTPDFPEQMLEQISNFSKNLTPSEIALLPKPEPHCNCPHCQIMKALHKNTPPAFFLPEEEIVEDKELKFSNWTIKEEGKNLYSVINPSDTEEHYQVFLGNPVGCTCGHRGCEHIEAVLRS